MDAVDGADRVDQWDSARSRRPGRTPAIPQVAVDEDGAAVIAWRRFDGANTRIQASTWERFDGSNYRVQATTRSSPGVLSVPYTLSDAGGDAHDSQVDLDARGYAYVAWQRFDGTDERIQYVAGP